MRMAAVLLAFTAAGCARATPDRSPPPAQSGPDRGGVVVCTSGEAPERAGADVLREGGTAADAALTAAITQVARCGGAYVSYAGVLSLVYFDADSGRVYYLDAGFNTPRAETDPMSIPRRSSGRTALVPGFMAGVQAAHDRFGRLPLRRLFDPAIDAAERGIPFDPDLAGWVSARRGVLDRLEATRRVFRKPAGTPYAVGDTFVQPALAGTLRAVAAVGAGVMYTGAWGRHFVEAVRADGGRISPEDLSAYAPTWEEPLRTTFRGHEICAAGFSSREGVNLVEAFNLLELADLRQYGPFDRSPEALFWMAQILGCEELAGLPPDSSAESVAQYGLDLSSAARVKKETAAAIWARMRAGTWPGSRAPRETRPAGAHTDAVVATDRWGNVAALTHTINTNLWGETGLFVDGVSIPDSAAFQQRQVKRAGPGRRLPDTIGPAIVLRDGRPVIASSATGSGLHAKTVQVLWRMIEEGADVGAAADAPYLLPRAWKRPWPWAADRPVARVIEGGVDPAVVEAVRSLGQPVSVLRQADIGDWGGWRGHWVGIWIDPCTGRATSAPAGSGIVVPAGHCRARVIRLRERREAQPPRLVSPGQLHVGPGGAHSPSPGVLSSRHFFPAVDPAPDPRFVSRPSRIPAPAREQALRRDR